ncbi:hypothetical protein Daura_26055 [Dactylosporangium aurantiacum]|uniref:Uncharacterized protein n=1 Tax=Dactylosporangium aurantiacum TaxID=35754 RepID=A0A9Q9I727_9ACTN|nr:hypothetical protein [Dactylosporangium aurantiacum]MDG6109700.1 hypothetical protein [Dactylosporangium aurantiacum]UWZ50311.1 hypothetical protein Daura_26055 [Dactylosporangium aurantiacum]
MDDRNDATPAGDHPDDGDTGSRRWHAAADAVTVLAVLAAVFGLAAMALARGVGPAQIGAMVLVVATAAGRLVHRIRSRRAARQWGPPAATEGPRPQTAEPLRRPDREHVGPRDHSVTECGDVTASLSARPRPSGAVPPEGKPVTHADAAGVDGPVGAGHSAARSPAGE